MNKYDKAWEIAKKAHKGQKRFNHAPYITHVREVVNILGEMGYGHKPNILIPAILHDVVEDGGSKYCKVITDTFGNKIASKVMFLTHLKEDTYMEYIRRLTEDRDCILVKIADMTQNLTETPKVKQREKYREALPVLMNSLLNDLHYEE